MKLLILISSIFLSSCQYVQLSKKSPSYHNISRYEESSEKVKEKAVDDYVSSHGEIELTDNKKVDKWIIYFQTKGRKQMEQYLSRSYRYIPMMKQVLQEYGLPENLVYVAMIESGFSPSAHSFANAVGYWQFITETGRRYGLDINSYIDERRDPILSTRAAAEYFKDLYGIFESWHLALASYNSGENRVNRFVMRYYSRDFWLISSKSGFPSETSNYVPKLIAAVRIGTNPARYGFREIEKQKPFEYETQKIDFPINLKKLAEKIDVDYKELKRLNPRYRGEYVHYTPNIENIIRIPIDKKDSVDSVLADCKMIKPNYIHTDFYWYRVRRGDTLYRLARYNRTKVSTIRKMNRMRRRSILRAGRKIKLPFYNKRTGRYSLAKNHTVRGGESLYSIARKYRVSISDLKRINNLSSTLIHPNQVLTLIESKKKKRKTKEVIKTVKNNERALDSKEQFHTVKKGETLISIAKRYNVTLPTLMKENSLSFESVLLAGSRIIIPIK